MSTRQYIDVARRSHTLITSGSQRVKVTWEKSGHLRRHRLDRRSRNRRVRLHPVMQGTAGFFSTVNTKETDWTLTEQDRERE